jgi:hypothetical protein
MPVLPHHANIIDVETAGAARERVLAIAHTGVQIPSSPILWLSSLREAGWIEFAW